MRVAFWDDILTFHDLLDSVRGTRLKFLLWGGHDFGIQSSAAGAVHEKLPDSERAVLLNAHDFAPSVM